MAKKAAIPLIALPPVLIEAVKSKRVIPFLGAGASKESKNAAGKSPPDANQLRDILAQKFFGKDIPNRDVMAVEAAPEDDVDSALNCFAGATSRPPIVSA